MDKNGVDNLRMGIVKQAVVDYASAKENLYTYNCTYIIDRLSKRTAVDVINDELNELRRFFRGKWYSQLCDLDADSILSLTDRRIREKRKKKYINIVNERRES